MLQAGGLPLHARVRAMVRGREPPGRPPGRRLAVVRWLETQRQLWAEQRLSQTQLRYMALLGEAPQPLLFTIGIILSPWPAWPHLRHMHASHMHISLHVPFLLLVEVQDSVKCMLELICANQTHLLQRRIKCHPCRRHRTTLCILGPCSSAF